MKVSGVTSKIESSRREADIHASTMDNKSQRVNLLDFGNDTEYLLSLEEYRTGINLAGEASLEQTAENLANSLQQTGSLLTPEQIVSLTPQDLRRLTHVEALDLLNEVLLQFAVLSRPCSRCEDLSCQVERLASELEEVQTDCRESLNNFRRYHEELAEKENLKFKKELAVKDQIIKDLEQRIQDIETIGNEKRKLEVFFNDHAWMRNIGDPTSKKREQDMEITMGNLEEPHLIVSPKPASKSRRAEENNGFYSSEETSDFRSYLKDMKDLERDSSHLSHLVKDHKTSIKADESFSMQRKVKKSVKKLANQIINNVRASRQGLKNDLDLSKRTKNSKTFREISKEASLVKAKSKPRVPTDLSIFSPVMMTENSRLVTDSRVSLKQKSKSKKRIPGNKENVAKNPGKPDKKKVLKPENSKLSLLDQISRSRDNKNLLF